MIDKRDYAAGAVGPQLSLQPSIRGDLIVTVVIRFEEGAIVRKTAVSDWLPGGRLTGGTVQVDHGSLQHRVAATQAA